MKRCHQAHLRRYARLGGIAGQANSPESRSIYTSGGIAEQANAPESRSIYTAGGIAGQANAPESRNIYTTGGLIVDDNKKHVTMDGDEVVLTATEYNILKLLASNLERVFTANQIYEAVWNEPAFNVGKIISVHIRHIREKIEINPKEPRYLKIVYGLGYKVVQIF